MSWSIAAKGKPVDVKAALQVSFEQAKANTMSVPVENKTVEFAERIVNVIIDDLMRNEFPQVSVSGYGSGCNDNPQVTNGWRGNVSFNLQVTPINEQVAENPESELG